jgi:hypothetical protein
MSQKSSNSILRTFINEVATSTGLAANGRILNEGDPAYAAGPGKTAIKFIEYMKKDLAAGRDPCGIPLKLFGNPEKLKDYMRFASGRTEQMIELSMKETKGEIIRPADKYRSYVNTISDAINEIFSGKTVGSAAADDNEIVITQDPEKSKKLDHKTALEILNKTPIPSFLITGDLPGATAPEQKADVGMAATAVGGIMKILYDTAVADYLTSDQGYKAGYTVKSRYGDEEPKPKVMKFTAYAGNKISVIAFLAGESPANSSLDVYDHKGSIIGRGSFDGAPVKQLPNGKKLWRTNVDFVSKVSDTVYVTVQRPPENKSFTTVGYQQD